MARSPLPWSRLIGLGFLLACIDLPSTVLGHFGHIRVKAGDSIQAAIDAAHPGAWIHVEAGTYAEQVTIQSDGIHLIGLGAILVPPSNPTENTCSGLAGPDTEAGICVTGHDVQLADFVAEHRKVLSVGRPVKDVLVTGFDVRGFSGINVAVVGGQDVQVTGNILTDGPQYGGLTVGSTNTHLDSNNVVLSESLGFIAICMDDLAGVQVANNHISGYAIGLCVQTPGADVRGNDVSNSCIGAFVDLGISGARVTGNHISNGNPICATITDPGIIGVELFGASNTEVKHNLIEGLTSGGVPNVTAVGVVILDDPTTGAVSSGNQVIANVLRNNDFDIYVGTAGAGNVIENNQCSTPSELCG